MESYELLTGVGYLYIAPVGESFPDLDAQPAGNWRLLGETQEGVTITPTQNIEAITVDQETGNVKVTRTEEDLTVETNLALATLENLADVLGNTVTDTAAGAGTIGTREVPLYRGEGVAEFALLFRGSSPYGEDYPAQYELPRGYYDGDIEQEYTKGENAMIPVEFHLLVNLNASGDAGKFGRLLAQDADAL